MSQKRPRKERHDWMNQILQITAHEVGALDSGQLQAFFDCLRHYRKASLDSAAMWDCFRSAFTYRPGGVENRRWLLTALQEAEQLSIIRFPSLQGSYWDHTVQPPLPTVVWKIQRTCEKRHKSWREYPWLPQLSWVAYLPALSPTHEAFLLRVQQEIIAGTLQRQIPLTYRSLQLTGNEKYLSELLHTALFQPGRLSLELLGCLPDVPPLVLEQIGEQKVALVFENGPAFRTAYSVLKHMSSPPYGFIGYGSGASFARSVLDFKRRDLPLTHIEYVGDLDRPGLRVAKKAAQLALTEGLPSVIPARRLHRAMLESVHRFGHHQGLYYREKEKRRDPSDAMLVAWLPEDVRLEILEVLQAGRRIPEEVLGPDELLQQWNLITFMINE
jgi:hypothetical protein